MKTIAFLLSLFIVIFSSYTYSAAFPSKKFLPVESAEEIAKSAIHVCNQNNLPVSVSIVNDQGRLLYFYRGEGTGSNTVKTSFRKAYTAATLKTATSDLIMAVETKGLSQLGKMEDDILLLTGGVPIRDGSHVVGAIGVSGAPSPQADENCAVAAIDGFMK
ncbi:GlcG/HbpS family heme-binding protein [Nitrincola sp.]|uniref:GlcG/HbpS family heme-binding protein n=1 Tax=Nitrincola sp. TaxID=1926584 RepID=UPI003A94B18E